MIKKLAIYTGYGLETAFGEYAEEFKDYTRVTEFVEVDFPELPKETIVKNQVATIDAMIGAIQEKAMEEVAKLTQKKSELLALTHVEQK